MATVKNLQPARTSILTPYTGVGPRANGFVGSKEQSFSQELHPVPPLHLDAQEPTPERLQKQFMDAYETLRRATLPMRQNPASAPCHSRGTSATATPASPQILLVPHALGRAYTGAHVCRHQGAQFQGHETVPGGVAYIKVTNGGGGYTTPPTVTVSGGGGHGAQAEAVLANGQVSYVKVISPGSGHSGAPSVTFTGGQQSTSNAASGSASISTATAVATLPPSFDATKFVQVVTTSTGTWDWHVWGD